MQGDASSSPRRHGVTSPLFWLLNKLPVSLQDMRSPRFAYKTEESHPDVVEALAKHAFPLSHSLVSVIQMFLLPLSGFYFEVTVSSSVSQPMFAFLYKEQFPVDGWKVYDPAAEYRRQVREDT